MCTRWAILMVWNMVCISSIPVWLTLEAWSVLAVILVFIWIGVVGCSRLELSANLQEDFEVYYQVGNV